MVAGDPVFLRTAAVETTGSLFPVLEIYDPQGTRVDLGSLQSFGPHKVLKYAFTAKSNGSYTVLVRDGSAALTNTGNYAILMLRPNRPCTNAQGLACDPVDGSVTGLLGADVYTVNGKSNDPFMVRLLRSDQSSSFRAHADIYDPQGNLFQSLDSADLARSVFTASSTGVYTVVVSDGFDNSQSGKYSLAMLPLNGACTAGTLSCGGVAAGNFSGPLATSIYSYSAAPGESFTVRMTDGSGTLQPSLEIYDSRGNIVGQSISGNLAGVDVTKPAGGTYTVIATDVNKRPAGGPFAVDLLRTANPCGVTSPQGQTVSGVISGAKPHFSYSIPASSGDVLSVRSAAFTSGFSALMDLYDPNGARVDSATFGLSRKVTASGNYTVIVGAAAARTGGAYSFAWQLLNHPVGAAALACGGSATASLTAAGEFRYYTVPAGAGDLMRLIFTRLSDDFAPQVELFDPAGTRLAGTSDISQKANSSGSYLVAVSPSTSNGETGSYALAYQRPNNPCSTVALTCGQSTLRPVDQPGQLDAFIFTGTGGDVANVKLTQRSGSYSPLVELYDNSGRQLATTSGGQLRSAIPANGTYALLVRDRVGAGTGSYRVSLQDDTNVCAVNDTEAPAIVLLQPTGGEVIIGGMAFVIQWLSDDNVGVASHDVALSTDGGQTFPTPIATSLNGNTQTYNWSVPADIATGRKAVLRVTATDSAGKRNTALSGLISVIGSGFTPNTSATYTYDSLNRLTQVTLNDGRTIQYIWDIAGNLINVTVSGQ
jgi:YD repeat-containing protein